MIDDGRRLPFGIVFQKTRGVEPGFVVPKKFPLGPVGAIFFLDDAEIAANDRLEPGMAHRACLVKSALEMSERSARIAGVFTQAGLDGRVSRNIAADVWHKLVINCVVNPITTILGCDVGGIVNPQLDPLKQLVIDECLAVAATQGVTLEPGLLNEIDDRFRPSHNINSTLQDLRRGRATEIDYLNGAVAALGARAGVNCPVNAALTSIIKAMEAASLLPKKMLQAEPA